jgi:signal transduction histidine kinase/DNA-binding NarL/FixJ family response regulator/HAMP domain-containing protein
VQSFSIARSLRFALLGLTVALAVIAALGVASLYHARQHYENTLARSSALALAAANLESAGIAQREIARQERGPGATVARREAARAYGAAAATAASLAREDPASARLIARQIAAGGQFPLTQRLAAQVQARQQQRQDAARATAQSQSRRALAFVVVAGVLALIGALTLITLLVRSMRRPLDELVTATRELAAGDLDRRVEPAGPRELRDLGRAFNAMAEQLASARERLEDQRQRLAVTIESLGDGLIVTEPGSTTIAEVNPRATELLPELSVGGRVDAPHSPLPALDDALGAETVVEHDGRTLAVTAARVGVEGGTVWTVRDTTERARLERAKSEFVATASHELRSPLTSIKGFVELLARSPEDMSERQQEFVDIILRSTDRLVDLVNDLLDVARIEAERVEINLRPIDVGEAVREVAELMGPRIEQKHQHLGLYISPALPLARADSSRVRQIVANLLTNAHLYTPSGGRIHVGVEAERAWVQIVVEDSGVGMDAEQTARVFERFYRGPTRTSEGGAARPAGPGTGLGLSIVKSLVELHHGEIEVDSQPGRGTVFRVRLPAATPARETGPPIDTVRGRRVLVVDDEPDIAELIADLLAPLEAETTIALGGEAALAELRSRHYDALTLDILMPGMDGFEVLHEIRRDPDLRGIPIVFVSVFSRHPDLAGEWVVSKPIDADELRHVLAAAVRAGRSRVLVVGREELQPVLVSALDELGIEHQWELNGQAAARVCGERRFEVALVDVGIRNPQAVVQALDLRGRRLRRSMILFSDGSLATPPGIERLGIEVVPVGEAANALLATLRGEPDG